MHLSTARARNVLLIALVGLLCAAGGLWWWLRPDDDGRPGRNGRPDATRENSAQLTQSDFQLAVEAVAATEEADFERASRLWAELIQVKPDDPDIQVNRAVAVLKWIDTIEKELSSGNVTPERQPQLLEELQAAYKLAEEAIAKLSATEAADPRVPLIESAILTSQANRLTYPADMALRKQAAEVLDKALAANPAQPLLAASFNDIVTVLAGDEPELEAKNKEYLYASWKALPRNLFLLRRAAETLLESEDPRLKELLQPSLELTRPMWSMLQAQIDRIKPDEMIPQVAQAIEAGEWDKTRPLRFWLNIIRGMPGFLSDARVVNPDPLALLDTSFLNRLAPSHAVDAASLAKLEYAARQLTESAAVVAWYDFDFDLQADVVAAQDQSLLLVHVAESQLEVEHRIEVGVTVHGMLAVDLFEVDIPDRPTLPASVAELMLGNQVVQTNDTGEIVPSGTRHDTLQELLIWGPDGVRIVGREADTQATPAAFQVLSQDSGLESLSDVRLVEAADIESDGDLDLLFVAGDGLHLMQNNGNRTFEEITSYSLLPPAEVRIRQVIASDYDRDLDQDFMLLTEDGGLAVFENVLHGEFRFVPLEGSNWPKPTTARGLAMADVDGNASWDWWTVGNEASQLTYTLCPAPGQITALRTASRQVTGDEVQIGDLNNDGLLDLVTAGPAGVRSWWHAAKETTWQAGSLPAADLAAHSLSLRDRDYDGVLEILAIVDGQPTVWSANQRPSGNYLDVRLAGINDINGGGRVNHYARGSVLQVWAAGQFFERYVDGPVTHFGFGTAQPDNLRVIFPNGLTQNVEDVPVNLVVEEKQVLRGSCPYLYGWDGEKFVFITDLLWNAPLGLQIARGQVLPDRRWENLLLPGAKVQPRDGYYELRITEELWEVAYLDQVRLTAVDHPADVQLFTNEKVGPPSIAEHQLFSVRERRYPESAIDGHGRDQHDKLMHADGNYAQAFRRQICQGLCEPHFLELDFGSLPVNEPLRLYLTGWMYPTDTSLNIGIDQNPQQSPPEPPSLWVVDEEGKWVCRQPFMGFPGGKPKSIVVDLKDVFLSQDHRLRIGGSQQIYWDEAFVSWDSDVELLETRPLKLESAELRYRGYSRQLPRTADQPHWYDYQTLDPMHSWPPLEGPFTRFGNVLEQLQADDDHQVVMTSGDEVIVRFRAPETALPVGWQRDFVMHNVGWDKDADINTLAGQGSMPLPFAEQQSYPSPPEQAEQAAAVWQKNAPTLRRFHRPTQAQTARE